jgi:hypothetical protein
MQNPSRLLSQTITNNSRPLRDARMNKINGIKTI